MFTGLVREVGRVAAMARRAAITVIEIEGPRTAGQVAIGDSVAVNGICLTATRIAGARIEVEATEETRRVTTLARWKAGDRVHLEPSLRVGDQLGGHFVLGHVDGVGRVAAFSRRGGAAVLRVELDARLAEALLPKGSIAVDGVSLTLDEGPFARSFTVTLVPHTLAATRFGAMGIGDEVNLELDVLAKAAHGELEGRGRETRRGESGRGGGVGVLTLASLLARGWDRRGR